MQKKTIIFFFSTFSALISANFNLTSSQNLHLCSINRKCCIKHLSMTHEEILLPDFLSSQTCSLPRQKLYYSHKQQVPYILHNMEMENQLNHQKVFKKDWHVAVSYWFGIMRWKTDLAFKVFSQLLHKSHTTN